MEENEKLQAKAVETVENEIRQAEEIKAERMNFMDALRHRWNIFAFQSTAGSIGIKVILLIAVFFSVDTALNYGLAQEGSLLQKVMEIIAGYTDKTRLVLYGIEILAVLFWLWIPALGTALYAVVLYLAYSEISPVGLLAAFCLLLLFQLEDRPVTAMLIALPVLIFQSTLPVSILIIVLAAFVSTRKNSGLVKTLGFVYFALLELCAGSFGPVFDAVGKQVIPVSDHQGGTAEYLISLYRLVEAGQAEDTVLSGLLVLLAVYFLVGAIFSKLLSLRFQGKKFSIDLKDGLIFAVLAVGLVAAPLVVARFSALKECSFSSISVILQVAAAYLLSRPVSGKSPLRRDVVMQEDRNYIFISYAHADIDRIRPYLKMLSKEGYEFWYDDSIKTGTEWQGVIASNLANCACFLAFISGSSIGSDYCLKEINYATSKQKPMAVILLDDVKLPPVLEMHFASLQAVQRSKCGSDAECMQKVLELEQLQSCKYG